MKKIFISFLFAAICVLSYADTIYFKDGNTLTGEILKTSDTEVIILSPLGTMTISKDTIDKVVKDREEVRETTSNINIVKKDPYKYDPDYQSYKKNLGLALAFFIPGNILFFGTLAIGTPFIINYYGTAISDSYYTYNYYGYSSSYSILPGATYGSLIITGLLLNCVSIPFFFFSGKSMKSFKERHKMGLQTGFDGDNFVMSFKISI